MAKTERLSIRSSAEVKALLAQKAQEAKDTMSRVAHAILEKALVRKQRKGGA